MDLQEVEHTLSFNDYRIIVWYYSPNQGTDRPVIRYEYSDLGYMYLTSSREAPGIKLA